MKRTLLYECVVIECGHHVELWIEDHDDEGWELHGHFPCDFCGSIFEEVCREQFPGKPLVHAD